MVKYAWTYHRQGVEHTCSSSWVSLAFAHSRIHGPTPDPSRLGYSFVINRFKGMRGWLESWVAERESWVAIKREGRLKRARWVAN
jgi:hypothetical protein